jgi:hypothetical protein
MSTDDLRIGHIDPVDLHAGLMKDGSKKRSRQRRAEREEEPIDQVKLSSAAPTDEQLPGYFPALPDKETK